MNDSPDIDVMLADLHAALRIYVVSAEQVCNDLSSMISSGVDNSTISLIRFIVLVKGSALTLWEWSQRNQSLGYIPNEQEVRHFLALINENKTYNFHLAYYYNTMIAAKNYVLVKLPSQDDNLLEIDKSLKDISSLTRDILNELTTGKTSV